MSPPTSCVILEKLSGSPIPETRKSLSPFKEPRGRDDGFEKLYSTSIRELEVAYFFIKPLHSSTLWGGERLILKKNIIAARVNVGHGSRREPRGKRRRSIF